ncbi:hypothetical protein P344_01295 [Spiroplasma mirum ATCC 29335]|uniref:Uncharacterized protein n=1 Tax=Spiroplasma mirum ATCC 29335 TaxID=838561 RepID=W0GKA1_9MOLU|nr:MULTISPECIES: hypothetical protein [Spiroplasma]AHF60665.1 hypothetical protein SMM_0208 [Spiroplasma mirum ATCC 29335]AHI57624.1 hypothetical protein P344_01295 [Spiroplasma mirum ATCC 29335]
MLTGLINYNLNKAVNPWTKENVNDKFKDWVNYDGTSAQWNQHININHSTNIAIVKEYQTKVNPIVSNDFFEQGLNGNLGSV